MALRRFDIQLAIPEDIYNAIPEAKKLAFINMVRELKIKAVKINAGKPNVELPETTWHRCYHDTGNEPCEAKNEICTEK